MTQIKKTSGRPVALLGAAVFGLAIVSLARAGGARADDAPANPQAPVIVNMCSYPMPKPRPAERESDPRSLIATTETEPNNSIGQANVLPLGTGVGQDVNINVLGQIQHNLDLDTFKVTAKKGDILGMACLALATLDPILSIRTISDPSLPVMVNDDHRGLAGLYPNASPFPGGVNDFDSALTYIVPADGEYFIQVQPFNGLSTGSYSVQIRSRRPAIESLQTIPASQIIFLDFDGAVLDCNVIFGRGINGANFSPLSAFLSRWELQPSEENAVINEIVATVKTNFDALRLASLNGDRDTDGINGHFSVEFRNSRDHPDPFGQANASRVVVGGTVAQSGINTIGLAQSIDPGNYETKETAIVLLDYLSEDDPSDPFYFGNSINAVERAPTVSKVQAIGRIIGQIVSHEIGHYLGCWHTQDGSLTRCIMDAGGTYAISELVGAGNDNVLGTADDHVVRFLQDVFKGEPEYIGCSVVDNCAVESTDVVVAFGLSTGALAPDVTAPGLVSESPPRNSVLGGLSAVQVSFGESVTDVVASGLTVNGSAATSVSGTGTGPYTFVGFAQPGNGAVNVQLNAGSLKDLAGNGFGGATWSYTILDCNGNHIVDTADITSGLSVDCNHNNVIDECDTSLLASRTLPSVKMRTGETLSVGDFAPIIGGTPPYTYLWTLRGNGTEVTSILPNPTFAPLAPGTYVVRLIATDAGGCRAIGYLTILVEGDNLTPPPAPTTDTNSGNTSTTTTTPGICNPGVFGMTSSLLMVALLPFLLGARRPRLRRR